jgi:hypothetical protein
MEILTQIVVPIVVALIGLVAALFKPTTLKGLPRLLKKMIAFSGWLLFAGSIVVIYFRLSEQKTANIIYPTSTEVVSIYQRVDGVYENLSADDVLWVVVYSQSDHLYFPHITHAVLEQNGTWSNEQICVGTPDDSGKTFSIMVLILQGESRKKIEEYLANPACAGLRSLPTRVSNSVSVIRQ